MAALTKLAAHCGVPADVGAELCQALGLAISNVSMYGMEHSVSAGTLARAFETLIGKMDLYGEIEFVLGDDGLMVNGSPVETGRSTGRLLLDQLNRLGVHDFEFLPPVSRPDFMRFMSIVAAAPGASDLAGGFEAEVANARLKSVRVANVSYARVDKDAALPPPPPPPPPWYPAPGGMDTPSPGGGYGGYASPRPGATAVARPATGPPPPRF